MCMYDPDGDYWEFSRQTEPTARKEYRCGECRRTIKPGEKYERFTGKSEGDLLTEITCRHCCVAREWLIVACEGWVYNAILEDLREHNDEHDLYRSETLQALIDGMTARWHDGADPVPDVAAVRASVPKVAA